MLKAIIIDDEPKNVRILNKLLQEFCPAINVVAEADNAQNGITVINKHNPDIVFLDIEMPAGNAFDMLDKLMPVNFEVIFITAFNEYTLKAFKYSALDYLLKPVDIDELKLSVQKAANRIHEKTINLQLANLLTTVKEKRISPPKIAIPTVEGLLFYNVEDIVRCEANVNYTTIFTRQNKKITACKNLKDYEDILPAASFCRIHNSHLVNLNYIAKYHRGRGGYVVMEDGTAIEVSSRRKEEFLARFENRG